MAKYVMWTAKDSNFSPLPPSPQLAIMGFMTYVSLNKTGNTIGIAYNATGPYPQYGAWSGDNRETAELIAVLLGMTEKEYEKYGPPESIELPAEERAKRGFS